LLNDSIQDLYDKETKHSLDTIMQKIWEEKIKQKLESIEMYSNIEVKRVISVQHQSSLQSCK